jgi:predicted transcriptional regulator
VSGNLLFDASEQDYDGDRPYWALRSIYSHEIGGGASSVPVEIDSEEWTVSLSHQQSGVEPRATDDVDQLYEYRLNANGAGHRKIRLLVQPRLDWTDDDRRPQSVPAQLGLATNVKVDIAVNVDPRDLRDLVPALFSKTFAELGVGWNDQLFRGQLHEYSNVTQLEQYVRIQRDQARKIVRLDGIFHRLFHLLAEREGSKIVYSADNRDIVGHNHQVRLDTEAISQLLDGWRTGGQFKHYHPEHVGDRSQDDPLHHPKIGFLFKKKWNDGHTVPWSRLEELMQQCEENLMNLLEWAGVPTKPGGWFVEDDHFVPTESDRDVAFFDDPTPKIEREQDSVILRTMQRLTDSDRDVLEAVALTDGGERPHVEEIEAATDWSASTIYRVLNRLGGLLESDNGNVQFVSAKIAERVQDVISTANDAVDAAARAVEDVLSVDPRDLERAGRAWQNWLNRYGAELVDDGRDDGKATIRIRQLLSHAKSIADATGAAYAPEILNYGLIAWDKAGRDPRVFRNAIVIYDTNNGTERASVKRLLSDVRDDVVTTIPG